MQLSRFKLAGIITFIIAIGLFACTLLIGNNQFFLYLNHDLGKAADLFFSCWSFLGDGIFWVLALLLFILFRKKQLPLLIGAFAFANIFIQLFKSVLLPVEPRPMSAIIDHSLIHTVNGVELHLIASFPSGHTTVAFTFFLLACVAVNKKWVLPVGLVYALLVGYSRVYLAQHFPRDVAGGMVIALLSVLLAVMVQKRWERPKAEGKV